jgi:adenine-specific DNA methylase
MTGMTKAEKNIMCARCGKIHLPSADCWEMIKKAQAKYRIEAFIDNQWAKVGSNRKYSDAVFNAENAYRSKRCDVRVIFQGNIVIMMRWSKEVGMMWEAPIGDLRA